MFSKDQIRPELKARGLLVMKLLPYFKESTFQKVNKVLDKTLKGRWPGKNSVCEQRTIKREDGSDLRILVITPKPGSEGAKLREQAGDAGVPGLLVFHGGGYGFGIPEIAFGNIDRFVNASGCTVVAPDYRLFDVAPFPAAFDDCYLALMWTKEHAAELGIRDDQLMLYGESAGGGATIAVAMAARDRGEVSVAYMMPLYPMLDDRMITPSSQGNGAPVWNSRSNDLAWRLYLGDDFGTDHVSPYAAPTRATDLAGLPPMLTFIGTIEPFYDETKEFIARLEEAGVPVSFREYEGCFHGFDLVGMDKPVGKDATAFMMDGFKYAVKNHFAPQP